MKKDVLKALRNVSAVLIAFLLIVLIGQADSPLLTIVSTPLITAGIAYGVAALEGKQPALKLLAGWAAIGLLAGIGFGIAL
jgi:heme/copper-type cytochrome/quinol oxidase subunit 3